MPLDFPTPPVLNQVYSFGGKSWKWNGDAWETYNDNLGVDFVETVNGVTGAVQGVSSFNGQTGAVSFHDYVASFNGVTGAVEGVCAAVAGTGISVSGATGTVTITNTGVRSFNGVTGAVQGVSSANGLTGAVLFRSGQGITHSNSGGGISFGINYLNGGAEISSEKYVQGNDIFVFQKKALPNSMARTSFDNLSYFLLGTEGTKGSGLYFRMAKNIDGGNGTVADEYVSFSNISDELIGIIDGGTFA